MTSTGETKVIERFDCSGCGDVDTSTVIRKVVDGSITGLTGRKLKVNSRIPAKLRTFPPSQALKNTKYELFVSKNKVYN